MEIKLDQKVAIVTGGTRGIGFAIVKTFLEAGAHVVFLGSRQSTVDQALEQLTDYKDRVVGDVVDSQDENSIHHFVQSVKEKFGHIDILVNNAGVTDTKPFINYEEGYFEKIMDLNVNFLTRMTREVCKVMVQQQQGVIINTSSMVSFNGQSVGVAYPTSKFAVNGITLSLARELGKYNIRVNAVAPGATNTDMVKSLNPEMVKQLSARIPLNRMAEPQDIANTFLFLASDLASYISGAVIKVDGALIV